MIQQIRGELSELFTQVLLNNVTGLIDCSEFELGMWPDVSNSNKNSQLHKEQFSRWANIRQSPSTNV